MTSASSPQEKTPCSRAALILINTIFVVAGVLMIVYGVKLHKSGWLDVFKEELPWLPATVFACMIALGCISILIAGMGCVGASLKMKGLLVCYNTFVIFAFVLVFLVMAGAFTSMYLAKDLSEKPYPGAPKEPSIADRFNKVYCFAEVAYVCNAAPPNEILNYLTQGRVTDFASSFGGVEGLNDICHDARAHLLLNAVPADRRAIYSFASACKECENVGKYNQYEAVYSWVNEQCPLDDTDARTWCQNLIFEGEKGETYQGAPYGACRSQFLNNWSKASMGIGIGMVAFLVFLLVAMISACVMTRRRRRNRIGADQDEAREDEGADAAHLKRSKNKSTLQAGDEEQQHQPQSYGATVY